MYVETVILISFLEECQTKQLLEKSCKNVWYILYKDMEIFKQRVQT